MRKKKSRLSIQKFTVLFLVCILVFSILKIGNTFASTDSFSLTNVVITEKSDTVVVNSLSFEKMSIINDIIFHKVGDSVKYKITVANNENENYIIKSIRDDSTNEYITYEYGDYVGTKVKAKGTNDYVITAKYANKLQDISQRTQKVKVSFIFELEDSKGNTKEEKLTVNPDEEDTPQNPTDNSAGTNIEDKESTDNISKDVISQSNDEKQNDNINNAIVKTTEENAENIPVDAEASMVEEKENIEDKNNEQADTKVEKVSTEVVAKHNNPKTGDEVVIYIATASVSFVMLTFMARRNKASNSKIKRYMSKKNKGFKTFSLFIAVALMIPCMSKASNNSFITTAENQFGLCDRLIVTTIIDGTKTDLEVEYGEIPSIDDPSKDGYDFIGWNLEDGTEYNISKPVENDIVLIAKFEKIELQSIIGTSLVQVARNATFDTGATVNVKMKKLAGTDATVACTEDINVKAIKQSEKEPDSVNKTAKNIVSSEESKYPIYMWYEDGTIYWWSQDKTPALNENSSAMFRHFTNLTDISGLKNFDASNAKNFGTMFANNPSMTSYLPIQNWKVSNVTAINSMFQRNTNLKDLEGLRGWNTRSITNMYNTFANCRELSDITALSTWNTASVETLDQAFYYCLKITDLTPISDWNVSNVKTTKNLFANCEGLTTIAPLAKWDTSNFEDIYAMFCCCRNVKNIDLGNKFGTSNVNNIAHMFSMYKGEDWDRSTSHYGPTSIKLGDKFDTSNVTTTRSMFQCCTELVELDLGEKFDTSNVTDMSYMFNYCFSLKTLDLSTLDMNKVTDTVKMICCTKIQELKTPKIFPSDVNVKIKLPGTFYDSEGNAYTYLDNTSPTSTWLRKAYTVKFDSNDGTGTMTDQNILVNTQMPLNENKFTKSRKAFIGWNTKADGTGTAYSDKQNVKDLESADGIVTLYAQWEDTIKIGDSVNYSTTLNGVELNNWKVFNIEDDKIYIILSDYLPNTAIDTTVLTKIKTSGASGIYAQNNRKELENALTDKSNWDSLLTGTLNENVTVNETRTDKVWAMGSPTIQLWTQSWNSVYPNDKLYTAKTAENMSDGLKGDYIGITQNPTTEMVQLVQEKGYDNTLYYPHKERMGTCGGYWLASPSAESIEREMYIRIDGAISSGNANNDWGTFFAARPVICLPANLFD